MGTWRDVEAVIKSAASKAFRKTTCRRSSFPVSWSPGFGVPGGCVSSRLDYGFQIPSHTHAAQPCSGPCSIERYCILPCKWRIATPASFMRVDEQQLCSISRNGYGGMMRDVSTWTLCEGCKSACFSSKEYPLSFVLAPDSLHLTNSMPED